MSSTLGASVCADPERAFGRESRSLKAIYELVEEGGWNLNNIRHVEGGFQQWRFQVGMWADLRLGKAAVAAVHVGGLHSKSRRMGC